MDADISAKFINSVVKSIQSVCHGYVEFRDNIKVIGHLYLSVDSTLSLNYIVNEQVCKNDTESSTMFLSNSYHSEPPAKKSAERDKQRSVIARTKQDMRESEGRLAPSDMGHVESDVMLFASENFPPHSNSESLQLSAPPHRAHATGKRKRTLSGGVDLGASSQNPLGEVDAQIVSLIEQDLESGRGLKSRRLSEGDNRVPEEGQDVLSFSVTGGSGSAGGDWDVNVSLQTNSALGTSGRDPGGLDSASASNRPGPTATVSKAPSTDHSKDTDPPSRASSTPSVKEEPQVDVDLTIVKEEDASSSQSSCMQAGKVISQPMSSGASNANFSSGPVQWEMPSHLQQQQDMHARVMRLDPAGSSVEYSSPPTSSTSQGPDHGGLNMLDNAQLFPVMLHPNTAASQDIMAAVSMAEARAMGQTLPSVMSFSSSGPMPSTSGHRMELSERLAPQTDIMVQPNTETGKRFQPKMPVGPGRYEVQYWKDLERPGRSQEGSLNDQLAWCRNLPRPGAQKHEAFLGAGSSAEAFFEDLSVAPLSRRARMMASRDPVAIHMQRMKWAAAKRKQRQKWSTEKWQRHKEKSLQAYYRRMAQKHQYGPQTKWPTTRQITSKHSGTVWSGQFMLHQAYDSYEEFEIAFEMWKRHGCHPMRTESSNILRELDPATNQRFRYSTIKFVCVHFGKPRVRGLGVRQNVKKYRQKGCDVMVRVKYYVDCGKLHITKLVDEHNHETSPELYKMVTQ